MQCTAYKTVIALHKEGVLVGLVPTVLIFFFLISQQSGCRNVEGKLTDSMLRFCHVSIVNQSQRVTIAESTGKFYG